MGAGASVQEQEGTDEYHYLDRLGTLEEDWFMLLHNLLQFNPYLRWSASECLNLEIFEAVRDESKEEKPARKILLDIDAEGAFDYSNGTSTKYTLKDYLAMIREEIASIRESNLKEVQTTKASTVLATHQSMPHFKNQSRNYSLNTDIFETPVNRIE